MTDSVSISEPTAITSSFTTTDVDCYGDSTGSATVIFNGGVTDYLLSWQNFTYPLPNGVNIFITPVGVPAGIYPYGVTDANGCTHFDTITIYQPTAAITASYNQLNVSACGLANGNIDATVSGGTQPYLYSWSNGDTTEDISNLSAGQYVVVVTDSNACIISDTIIITQPSNLFVTTTSPTINGYHIACTGDSSGSITAQVSGSSGYTYLWSDGQTTVTASGLAAGTYTLTVTDSSNCSYSTYKTLIEPATVLNQNITSTNVLCNDSADGTISINLSGGVPNYNTNWGGITNPNALAFGQYLITTTDSNGCVAIDSAEISQPNLLSGSILITSNYNGEDVSCNGNADGSVMANIFGGTLLYSYLWSTGGNGYAANNLPAGTYTLTVTDSNNCVTTLNTTLYYKLNLRLKKM